MKHCWVLNSAKLHSIKILHGVSPLSPKHITKGHHALLELHGELVAEGIFNSYTYSYYKADGTIDDKRKTSINLEMLIFASPKTMFYLTIVFLIWLK